MSRHEGCAYPNCLCLRAGRTCRVADAAKQEPYCSFCKMLESDVERGEDCGSYEVCSRGGAVMVNPLENAIASVKGEIR